ncbi:MAG TPA: GTPase HflX, partial [Aestuariivirga sp.]|nr:GTPase HflX [Aestuariivirga sp.]
MVIHVEPRQRSEGVGERDAESRLAEAVGLAQAIDLRIAEARVVPWAQPKPATLLGSGKVTEIAD